MKFDTAYNHRERIVSMLGELYNMAEICGMESSAISKRRNEIMATLPKKTPQWVTAYVEGWERCMRSFIERKLVFAYTVGGKLYSTHRNREDYYEKHGIGPREVYEQATLSGHYWEVNGELRPYYVSDKDCKE